jgi:hypothetical protein
VQRCKHPQQQPFLVLSNTNLDYIEMKSNLKFVLPGEPQAW